MLLTIDVGNTNIAYGVFSKGEFYTSFRMTTKHNMTVDELGVMIYFMLQAHQCDPKEIQDTVISSVVPPITPTLVDAVKLYLGVTPLIVGPGTKTGISIQAENAKEVGADRIVNVAAAHMLYKRECIVIDFGTATTFDHVSADGVFSYTIIMPGLKLNAEALSSNTAKLPRIELKKPDTVLTRNTVSGMQAGLIYGYIGSINYIVSEMSRALGTKPYTIATGGLGKMFAEECESIDEYNPNLAYIGMKYIYEKNR